MKKIFFTATGIVLFAATNTLLAASFTIDNLNLREAIPNVNPPVAYFKIGLEDTWNKINEETSLYLSPIVIGIIDSGVDITHKEFDGIKWGKTPASAKIDFGDNLGDSHGTNVVGIIGANNISAISSSNYVPPQMNGVLSGVKNLNYTLENRGLSNVIQRKIPGSIFSIAAKIQDIAKNGGQVINISQSTDNVLVRIQEFLRGTLEKSFSSYPNILFVVSAGNDGKFAENSLPARLSNLPNVITVGATTIDDIRYTITQDGKTTGSNFGNEVSLSAPGDSVFSPTFYHAPLDFSDYEYFSGTSASAPLVTGVAGLLKAIKPSLTPSEIKQILIRTADPITTDQPIGGRLNAYNAVCDSEVGLNCETDPVAFFEGWESVPLGHPLCETLPPYMTGYGVCGFTADSGKWVVTDLASIGSPMLSVEILPGKILKLKPQINYMNGFLFRQIRTAGNFFMPIFPTTSLSFTDFSVSTTSVPSRVDFIVSFNKTGNPALCPDTGDTTSFTTIWYVLEDNSGNPPEEIPPCTARIILPPSSSFSRNLYDDIADLLPFSPEGWELSHIMFQVFSYDLSGREVAVTWDNVKIMR